MPCSILSEITMDVSEHDLQKAIENKLNVLQEGLEYVDSEVTIGTSRIDTLAVDDDGRPTFIEYKKPGSLDRNVLIQSMDYLSWFVRDPNRRPADRPFDGE